MVEADHESAVVHARVPVEEGRLLGFIRKTVHSTVPITEAVRRIATTGDWSLLITDLQVKLGGFGRPRSFDSPLKGYRRVPLDLAWLSTHDLGELAAGDYFFLLRGGGSVSEDDFLPEPSGRALPDGAEAMVAFDPDLQWFDAVFRPELFGPGLAAITSAS